MLASGTAGFGREVADVIEIDGLGGIVTKAVSPEPRHGHTAPRVTEFEAGMLNAVGLANPGLEHVAEVDLPWLARHVRRARVLVNVVGNVIEDFVAVVSRLSEFAVVTAFELNVSCPNTARGGEEFCTNESILATLVERCRAASLKPLIVKLAPTLADIAGTAALAARQGADGFTLVNTMPGTLYRFGPRGFPVADFRLGFGKGGVSGPALLPVGVLAVQKVRERTGMPVIGVGGIRTSGDVEQYLAAGASLVAVGTAALAHPRVPGRLVREWEAHGAHVGARRG